MTILSNECKTLVCHQNDYSVYEGKTLVCHQNDYSV